MPHNLPLRSWNSVNGVVVDLSCPTISRLPSPSCMKETKGRPITPDCQMQVEDTPRLGLALGSGWWGWSVWQRKWKPPGAAGSCWLDSYGEEGQAQEPIGSQWPWAQILHTVTTRPVTMSWVAFHSVTFTVHPTQADTFSVVFFFKRKRHDCDLIKWSYHSWYVLAPHLSFFHYPAHIGPLYLRP